jgi:hypothetical protein
VVYELLELDAEAAGEQEEEEEDGVGVRHSGYIGLKIRSQLLWKMC